MIDRLEDYTVATIAFMKAGDQRTSFYDKDGVYYPSSNTVDFAVSHSIA
nr:MAG TPA: hypothetical protein [Caudoviricetes sp.]